MHIQEIEVRSILTRSSGYLKSVCSHSLNPYRGCTFGSALCGVGCYVRQNIYVTKGREWGSFLEVKTNATAVYRATVDRERKWARDGFSIFMASSTDPFLPQERTYGITASLLHAMLEQPPDRLTLQTHSADVARHRDVLLELKTDLRVHISLESDRDRLPGLPPPASTVAKRMEAARTLHQAGLRVVITVSPLLPIRSPAEFFTSLGEVCDAVVIDHFVGGDGSRGGTRTRRTALPEAMENVLPGSTQLAYRDLVVAQAHAHFPGPVGVGEDGFAGRYLDR